jgi:hypothetical protein
MKRALTDGEEFERLQAELRDQNDLYRHDVAKLMDEIERLRAALEQIAASPKRNPANPFLADDMARCARYALQKAFARGRK